MHGPAIGELRLSLNSTVIFQAVGEQGPNWTQAQVSINGTDSKVYIYLQTLIKGLHFNKPEGTVEIVETSKHGNKYIQIRLKTLLVKLQNEIKS